MTETDDTAKKKRGCVFWGLVVMGVFFAIGILGMIFEDPEDRAARLAQSENAQQATEDGSADAAPESERNDPGISAEEFAAIRPGMTEEEVTAIVGSPGELMSENALAGTTTVMVQWDGEDTFSGGANVIYQNGRVFQKSQFGL